MPTFRYEALDPSGQSKSGEIEAEDATSATKVLADQSLVVLSLQLVRAPDPPKYESIDDRNYEQKINAVLEKPDKLIALLEAISAEPASTGLRKELDYLLKHLHAGVTAQQLLGNERLSIWLPIIMSSEGSADVERRYSQWLSQILDERTRKFGLALTFMYPLILIGFVLMVFIPICVFIVPEFQKMYDEFGLTLPAPTASLFALADLINYRPLYLISALTLCLSIVAGLIYWWISQGLTTRLFGWLVAGNSVSLVAMSRLTSVLAELLELGAPLSEALLLSGKASRHAYFGAATRELAVGLADPNFTWQMSRVAHNFPLTLLHALSAGPDNRASVPLIRELSHAYSDRVSARMSNRTGAASPVVVMAVGLAVGFVVIALFMPMVSMITSLS